MDDYSLWIVLAGGMAVLAAALLVWAVRHRRAQLARAARREQGDWQQHDSVSGESLDSDDSLPHGELPSNAMARARADAQALAARTARTARTGSEGRTSRHSSDSAQQARQAADRIIQREIEQAALRRAAARRAREEAEQQALKQQAAAAAAEQAAVLSASQQKAALAASRLRAERLASEQRAATEAAERRAAKEAAQRAADEAATEAAVLAERVHAQQRALHEAEQAAEKVAAEVAQQAAQRAAELAAAQVAAQAAQAAESAAESAAQAAAQAAQQAQAATLRQASRVDTASPRSPQETLVMVADDSKVVRIKTSRLLALHHYRVVLAEDGIDALQKMADEAPHVLITDVEMPGMDGFELTRHVRGQPHLAHIPIIMITSADERLRQAAADAGVTVLLGKPYPEAELMARLEQANQRASVTSTLALG